jgi:hypothetical protein
MHPLILFPLRSPPCSSALQVFVDLDVAKAEATEEEDLRRIMKDIQEDVGVQVMTHQVGGHQSDCCCGAAVALTPY